MAKRAGAVLAVILAAAGIAWLTRDDGANSRVFEAGPPEQRSAYEAYREYRESKRTR